MLADQQLVAQVGPPLQFRLTEEVYGPLFIYAHPEPGAKYVIGADASSGAVAADFAVAMVLETKSCAIVARLTARRDPIPFGRLCAMLAWHYNGALLAFETHPSQHGVSACIAARDMGYPNLYRRYQLSTVHQKVTQELGWATTMKTKPLMVDAVRAALADKMDIPDRVLLHELMAARYKENDDLIFENSNDDHFTAFAIALLVRRHAVQTGFVTPDGVQAVDERTMWWQHRKRQLREPDDQDGTEEAGLEAQDGC